MQCKALFIFFLLPCLMEAQNLVPNWSFEEYDECPDGMTQIEKATGWMSFRMSPDYYNACDLTEVVGVPYNGFTSYKQAIHGNGYAGFGQLTLPSGFREILGIELSEPLEIGVEYYVSFFVSRGIPPNSDCWANKIGVRFVNQEFIGWPLNLSIPITNYAHVYTDQSIIDTIGWTKIEGTFMADSSYSFLAVGNHFEDTFIEMTCNTEDDYMAAYYFIDCVCVSVDANECPVCKISTGNSNPREKKLNSMVYPNPFSNQITIVFPEEVSGQKVIEFYGVEGKLIHTWGTSESYIIGTGLSDMNKGLYVLRVRFENGNTEFIKIIKN